MSQILKLSRFLSRLIHICNMTIAHMRKMLQRKRACSFKLRKPSEKASRRQVFTCITDQFRQRKNMTLKTSSMNIGYCRSILSSTSSYSCDCFVLTSQTASSQICLHLHIKQRCLWLTQSLKSTWKTIGTRVGPWTVYHHVAFHHIWPTTTVMFKAALYLSLACWSACFYAYVWHNLFRKHSISI